MPKKDAKAKKATKKLRSNQKAEKIATKKEKKSKTKGPGAGNASDAESDVDLDAVLATYAAQQEQFHKVTEAVSPPPSARASATLLASPSNSNELLLFGGEYFNGALARFYNDLFVYNVVRDEWKVVTSPNAPLPRSGHAWCRGGNAGGVWLFGGEFSSPKQGTFYHYGDFWRLEPGTREWAKVETKGKGPPARSGHRMVYFKVRWACGKRACSSACVWAAQEARLLTVSVVCIELHHPLRGIPRYVPNDQIPFRSLAIRHRQLHVAQPRPTSRIPETRSAVLLLLPSAR